MCNCIKELEKKVLDHVREVGHYKKPVLSVNMTGKIFSLSDGLTQKLSTNFEVELEGQKKRPFMPVTWTYCPFCGEKLIADDKPSVIKLSPAEIHSGLDRVKYAESLIEQLPVKHEGRKTWLLNYGIGSTADYYRTNHQQPLTWNDETQCLNKPS